MIRGWAHTLLVPSVIGREIDNKALAVDAIQSVDVRRADTVGKGHDPAVHLALTVQLSNILGRQGLVDDLALAVSLEFLASKLSGRDVRKFDVRVLVKQLNQR